MAIESTDNYISQVFTYTYNASAGDDDDEQQLSLQNYIAGKDSVIVLEIVVSGLDSPVTLSLYQGMSGLFSSMSPINDDATNQPIIDTLDNGNYIIKAQTSCVFIGWELLTLSATTGTITITGRG